ncbi:hypothetical protein DVA86_19970 [Streptomyces armeniacus]|uniref:Uncharacterized protein n=1 Tax=Streptomyces armeniacus TaxID=83291 RepID=A0A345XSG9_9ACTN|nr:hypothetical protein [Streptomyces armeniacus]AXK34585.1 hypothetical protein DVA86_19970 [Streptomyces armeniacus]
MAIKKTVARAAAVAVIAAGGLVAGTSGAAAGDNGGAPTSGLAPMGDDYGAGYAAPMGDGSGSPGGAGVAPPEHDWGIAPAFDGDGSADDYAAGTRTDGDGWMDVLPA